MIVKTVVASLLLSCFAFAGSITERQVSSSDKDPPAAIDRSKFIARKWFASIVVGKYLYIDGGELSYKNGNSTVRDEARSTYSIDLSSPWTNETVSMKQIDKAIDGRALNWVKLWPALDNSSFYSYNGEKSWFRSPATTIANKLYKFTSDHSGGGQWSEEGQNANTNFISLSRVGGSASACGRDVCYAVGGLQNSRTSGKFPDGGIAASGLVSYNLSSHVWRNDSLIDTVVGPWSDGQLFFTDIAGSHGILIAMGGARWNLVTGNSYALPFGMVNIYDIATKTWYEQVTAGEVPSLPRQGYCTVGIQGDNPVNRTYEVRDLRLENLYTDMSQIFMYGGESSATRAQSVSMDDVWLLSVPSFQWRRAGHKPVLARYGHSCNVVGGRQMAIIGGITSNETTEVPDTWSFGLGIFDLSEMVFKNSYNASEVEYISPAVVKQWYADNGYVAKEANDTVKRLFGQAPLSPNTTESINDRSVPGHVRVGAIVGGVVALALISVVIGVGIWLYIRRKERQRRKSEYEREVRAIHENNSPELDGRQYYEKETPEQRHELY